ncbi:MAG: MFS transporter [Pseudomonadales bacterium]|jgi:OFA family oxalate/formate antiporter-like MFS transporter|tara:strand:- start:5953 stop:7245 length:1293 start_codon:yes stop_codon:yes gene_type:complete
MLSYLLRRNNATLFLGWRMVAVAFLVDFIAVGFFFYSYGIFFKAIAVEFGDSRFGVSIGVTVTQGVGALLAPFIGRALDRFPLKNVMACGAISMGTGFGLLGLVQTPLQFYLVLGVFVGFGAGAMGQLATSKLVSNWFVLKRGSALGIAATGISVSGVIMPAISAWIIATFGWREAFMTYGLITFLVVVPVVLRLVISRPEDVGLLPDGATEKDSLPPPKPPLRTRDFLSQPNFWVLLTVIGLLFCIQSATLIHMVPKLTDSGLSLVAASGIASATAGFGIMGKLIFGALVDRWDVRHALWLGIGFQFVGQLMMVFMEGHLAFLIGACFFGFGMGGVVPMQGAVVGAAFGRESFGRVLGAMRPPMAVLHLAGTPFAGWVYDVTGSYRPASLTFLVLYLIAAVVVLALKVETRSKNRSRQPATDQHKPVVD